MPLGAVANPDMRAMYEFLSDHGYSVEPRALRARYPEVGWIRLHRVGRGAHALSAASLSAASRDHLGTLAEREAHERSRRPTLSS